jgi:hypothetical protein
MRMTFKKLAALMVVLACTATPGCGGGGGSEDGGLDPDSDAPDVRPEICFAHPNTCNTGGGGIEPYDCCSPPRTCCNLCFPPDQCGSRTDCLERCPQTIPCEGLPDASRVSCYFDPDDFSGTAYCPVHLSPSPLTPTACTADCPTGVECPLPEEMYGDTALCCPEGRVCDVTPLYDLPVCVAP